MRIVLLLGAACTPVSTVSNPEPEPPGPTDDLPVTTTTDSPTETKTEPKCAYPFSYDTAMLEGAILEPFGWKTARHRDGREAPLYMEEVFCNDAPDMDWSPFDVLVFVAIPAW